MAQKRYNEEHGSDQSSDNDNKTTYRGSIDSNAVGRLRRQNRLTAENSNVLLNKLIEKQAKGNNHRRTCSVQPAETNFDVSTGLPRRNTDGVPRDSSLDSLGSTYSVSIG